MVDSHATAGPARPDPTLYPDLARAGSLQAAVQDDLARSGHRLNALAGRAPGWRYVGARIENDQRHTSILIGIRERVFLIEFWAQGVMMAQATTVELHEASEAAYVWHTGSSLRDLRAAWPFVRFGTLAQAHERGDAPKVKWQMLRDSPHLAGLYPLIDAALTEPRLGALFPYTSLATLHLSRCTGYPYTTDLPYVKPLGEGRLQVIEPTGLHHTSVGAADAVALLLTALPRGCGPAGAGTAEQFTAR
jgi:hypothetical protein